MYEQTYGVNENIAYVGGLCEGYVEGTAGQATVPTASNHNTYGVFPSAAAAWNANYGGGNHPGEQPPSGVKVAVHFKLKNNQYDHVAVSLGNGKVASSTQAGFHMGPYVHPSLQDLVNIYAKAQGGCTYLGWSEYIGRQRVVKKKEQEKEKPLMVDKSQLEVLYRFYMGTGVTAYGIENRLNKQTFAQAQSGIIASAEFKALAQKAKEGKMEITEVLTHLPSAISSVYVQPSQEASDYEEIKETLYRKK